MFIVRLKLGKYNRGTIELATVLNWNGCRRSSEINNNNDENSSEVN